MIVFEDHYSYDYNPYNWDYLIDSEYKTEFDLSFFVWNIGNGNWSGYNTYTNKMYWKESLIYEI